ncbi:sarcosine oxidase subunit gamma [Kocuria palustris]|uniref:sarcosine oxidase subunit gamma n=1 Tax=Kocuria palustris TaxID=71999 RepID=UPI0011A8986C|nr:sarcosine oxidase subunit gamma family protein [Kocuria palustris]
MAETADIDIAGLRRSPLQGLEPEMAAAAVSGERGVALREVPFQTLIALRVTPGSEAAAAVESELGVGLPGGCGEVTGSLEETSVLWNGPDDFTVVRPDAMAAGGPPPEERTARLAQILVDRQARGQAVDVSANRTTIEVSGPSARTVLDKGCRMDLHPRAFPVGHAVSTNLGVVQVLLWRTGEHTWRIMPRSSFAEHTARWIMDGMAEFAADPVA